MSDPPDDSDIVRGLRRGDRQAWDALCHAYGDRLYRYVARLIGRDVDAALDVFQEVMLAAASSGRGLREETRLWSWLATIGHNKAALHWRKHYRERHQQIGHETPQGSRDDDPEELLTRSETIDSIRGILAEMRAEHVTLLSAKYIDGLSVRQIAIENGGTEESIRSKLTRARTDFRQRYDRLTPASDAVDGLKSLSNRGDQNR